MASPPIATTLSHAGGAARSYKDDQFGRGKTLIFVTQEDWPFFTHRLPLALAARDAGFRVMLATRFTSVRDEIAATGIETIPLPVSRAGMNPYAEWQTYRALVALYRAYKPDLVHHVTQKPVVYGTLAARTAGVPAVVNALGGLGYLFNSETFKARILRAALKPLLRSALGDARGVVVLQNTFNQQQLADAGLIDRAQIALVRGSGVDPSAYPETSQASTRPLVILPARLLRDKGVCEFVEAARILHARGVAIRMALVGTPDLANPTSVTLRDVEGWVEAGLVEDFGWRNTMAEVYGSAQIVCLPSYHEGLPRALLEGGASGCALVTTDIPGCRAVVENNVTGVLVPPRNATELADALETLANSQSLRERLGGAAQARVREAFSLECVTEQMFAIYRERLDAAAARVDPA
ncbi:MAG: glycosyltransferase family 4 protein [Pseudomonadota bacterium]